jgi:hypothetical protein
VFIHHHGCGGNILKMIFFCKKNVIIGEGLYSSPSVAKAIKLRGMGGVGHVECKEN